MRNRKLRIFSILFVLILLTTSFSACKKASSSVTNADAIENVEAENDSTDEESENQESSEESTEQLLSSEESSETESIITVTEDGTTIITSSDGTQITVTQASGGASQVSQGSVVQSAVSGVSSESDNSTVTSSVSNSAVSLHTFSPITASELQAAQSIVNSIISSSMSEYTKVKTIHDYLVDSITYPSTIDTSNRSLFTCTGALINKVAVCQGYADAFSLLCYLSGVQADIVSGPANNGSSVIGHAWNQVRINGTWYNIDCTWDAPVYSGYGQARVYNYFLITDSTISADHTINASASAGYLAARHTCTDSSYEANNAYLTDDSLYSFFLSANYGGYQFSTVTSTQEAVSAAQSYVNSSSSSFIIVYKNSSFYTTQDEVKNAAASIVNSMYGVLSGSNSSISYGAYDLPTRYLYIIVNRG